MALDLSKLDEYGIEVSESLRECRTRILNELRISCPSDGQFNALRKRIHDILDDVHESVNEMMKYITDERGFKSRSNSGLKETKEKG